MTVYPPPSIEAETPRQGSFPLRTDEMLVGCDSGWKKNANVFDSNYIQEHISKFYKHRELPLADPT